MNPHPAFLLTGDTHSGKTTCLISMLDQFREKGWKIEGWTAPAITGKVPSTGYNLRFVNSGDEMPFCRTEPVTNWLPLGRFWYNPAGVTEGSIHLERASHGGTDLVVIDEIGPFDLAGMLWGPALDKFISRSKIPLLLVVRNTAVNEVITRWNLRVMQSLTASECFRTEKPFIDLSKYL